MTKLELAKQLAAAEGLTHTKALSIVDNVVDLIVLHFVEGGEKITIRGFGTIKIWKRRAYTGTDPHGRLRSYNEQKSITLRPSAETLRRIN